MTGLAMTVGKYGVDAITVALDGALWSGARGGFSCYIPAD